MSDEEKEQKPKKLFTITHTVWDDGEIDSEMYEFRKNPSGRGAPGKWRLGKEDFKRRVGEVLGEFDLLVEDMNKNIAAKEFASDLMTNDAIKKIKEKHDKELKQENDGGPKKSKPPIDETEIDPDFGEFDNDK